MQPKEVIKPKMEHKITLKFTDNRKENTKKLVSNVCFKYAIIDTKEDNPSRKNLTPDVYYTRNKTNFVKKKEEKEVGTQRV